MIKVGAKGNAAIMMVAASSPSSVGGRCFRRNNLHISPLSRTGSSCSEVVSEKKSGGGEYVIEGRAVGDIQVYSRVTDEIHQFNVQDKKRWWMPHPLTGEFRPYEQEALDVTMEKDEKTVKGSAGELAVHR